MSDTTDELVVVRPRGRKVAIQLIDIATKQKLDATVAVRPLSDGYEVPKSVADKYNPDADVTLPDDPSFAQPDTKGEGWTESTIHPDEATTPEATIASESKAAAARVGDGQAGHQDPSDKTQLADGESADEKTEAPAAEEKPKPTASKTATK